MSQDTPDTEPSHESDQDKLIEIFRSRAIDAEIEAEQVHAVLQSAGIESVVVEPSQQIPPGRHIVRVLESEAEEARAVIKAALESGESEESEEPTD